MDFWTTFFRAFNLSEPGSGFMWVLLAFGVAALVLMVERGLYLMRRSSYRSDLLLKEILKSVEQGDIAKATKLCDQSKDSSLAHVLRAGLANADQGSEKIQNAMDEETLAQLPKLEGRTTYLSTLANSSTLIGLMGTIYGLIVSFAAVGKPGIEASKKSELLAQGISAAMNTTLMGLAIAIPCMLVFSYYSNKGQRIADEVEEHSTRLLNVLTEKAYKTQKFQIKVANLKDAIGLHVTNRNIKIYGDEKLIKEINL